MSKKLSGNGRWESSRMMLPEHRTQFLERHEGTNPTRPTKEELELIRASVILPMLLSVAERNRQQIELSSYTFRPLYLRATELFIDAVQQELAKVKRDMKQSNIKVMEEEQAEMVMYFRFICRGYEERFGIVREVVRAEIAVRATRYMRELFQSAAVK